jgi:hypothetical protein
MLSELGFIGLKDIPQANALPCKPFLSVYINVHSIVSAFLSELGFLGFVDFRILLFKAPPIPPHTCSINL